jgi:hypothetical protein
MRDGEVEESEHVKVRTRIRSQKDPTFQWTGVSISDEQNFCSRMTSILGDASDLKVPSCDTLDNNPTDCPKHYQKDETGGAGAIEHCKVDPDDASGQKCIAGAQHTCTWSFYMEDLIKKHNATEDNCAAKLLEAKRSLDGLLHSVQDVYNLMQWNAIVQAENSTIRGLLEDQQEDWDEYVSEQQRCDSLYSSDQSNLQMIENEMTELRAIANPAVRSAVDVHKARGYQSSGETSVSCPAQFPYVNTDNTAECCKEKNLTSGIVDCSSKLARACKDANDNTVPCVDNARVSKWGAGTLTPSKTAANALVEAAGATSFVEMDESSCQTFTSLLERVQKSHGKKIKLSARGNCHEMRSELEADFKEAFKVLGHLYNEEIYTMEENRSICLNTATYNYKAGVEGIDGIDDQIQDAAGKIHEAQGEIARLEPMLHDVERAVSRMREYVDSIKGKCESESYVGHLYEQIRDKIKELQECPGRNDFIIDVPHWRPKRAIGAPTPAPTPWYDDPKANTVRSIL